MSDCVRSSQFNVQDSFWIGSYQPVAAITSAQDCQNYAMTLPDLSAWYYSNGLCNIASTSNLDSPLTRRSLNGAVGGIIVCQNTRGFWGTLIIFLIVILAIVALFFYLRKCKCIMH